MLLAVLAGFLLALVIAFFGRFFKGRLSVLLGLLPLGIFNYFLYYFPYITAGNTLKFSYQWIPSLGLNLDFRLDGLSLLFSLLISGIGALVFFYASAYLQGHKYLDRFYGYLSLFMAAMLGLVLSDNVLLVFTFWELTSISSFFLIGFNNDSVESRKSALTALAITGLGGFFLLSGFILMGLISETYSITGMLLSSDALHEHPFYGLMLFFLFIGAFSKSAQYPLHFWLPGAMKAPTPVSAYLHSATMVKAGIYLLARLSPVMGNHPYWNITLMVVGGITMLYAAIHTLFKTDLKSILAYSTISALGVCVFLLGIGTAEAILALSTFILVHALYKAALFLVTGTIDHETGTRDVMKLQGLRKQYPLLAGGALIAALSNAGIPLTFGFIGKDLMYEATLHGPEELKYILTGIIVTTNILLAYAGFMVGIKPFIGAEMIGGIKHVHKPSLLLTVPPILLGIFSLLFGIAPMIPDELIVSHTTSAILGTYFYQPLKIWHGFNLVLLLSGVTIFLGFVLFRIYKPRVDESESLNQYNNRYAPKSVVDRIGIAVRKFALYYTRFFNDGYLRSYVLTIIVFFVALIGYKLFSSVDLKVNMSNFTEIRLYELVIFGIMVVAIIMSVFTSSRLTAIASMSVIGYAICLLYVFYGAPDLAMTQFTIDTLTVVLFVLVLFRLPQFMNLSSTTTKIRDGIVSLSFGSLISIITLQALISPANKEISRFYADNAYRLAKGKNVVNVILVDFRGFDTMVEIMVLTIAALGVFSLLKLNAKPTDKD